MERRQRVSVMLDAAHAEKLRQLAERARVDETTLACTLLARALDEADPDPCKVIELLGGIEGAFERAQRGAEQARAGHTVPLDEL